MAQRRNLHRTAHRFGVGCHSRARQRPFPDVWLRSHRAPVRLRISTHMTRFQRIGLAIPRRHAPGRPCARRRSTAASTCRHRGAKTHMRLRAASSAHLGAAHPAAGAAPQAQHARDHPLARPRTAPPGPCGCSLLTPGIGDGGSLSFHPVGGTIALVRSQPSAPGGDHGRACGRGFPAADPGVTAVVSPGPGPGPGRDRAAVGARISARQPAGTLRLLQTKSWLRRCSPWSQKCFRTGDFLGNVQAQPGIRRERRPVWCWRASPPGPADKEYQIGKFPQGAANAG